MKKLFEISPETSRNRFRISKNRKKSFKKCKMAQDAPKNRKKAKKCKKIAKKWPKSLQKGPWCKTPTGYAMPCLKSDRTKIGPLTLNVQPRWGGTPAHCLRFANPAEATWRLEARRLDCVIQKTFDNSDEERATLLRRELEAKNSHSLRYSAFFAYLLPFECCLGLYFSKYVC